MDNNNNRDLHLFYTTKVTRWKGNYPRVFSVGTHGLSTYNLDSLTLTNHFQYVDLHAIQPTPTSDHPHQFTITFRKGAAASTNKTDSMRFESDYISEILTLALEQGSSLFCKQGAFAGEVRSAFVECPNVLVYRTGNASSGEPVKLKISTHCVKFDTTVIYFKDIDTILTSGQFFALRSKHSKFLDIFSMNSTSSVDLPSRITRNSSHFLNHPIPVEAVTYDIFSKRLGNFVEKDITSLSEFTVLDATRNRIVLCVTETCIVERDVASYLILRIHPLSLIYAIVRPEEDDLQLLYVEFTTTTTGHGQHYRAFYSTERDNLVATLLDGARGSGNAGVHVKSSRTDLGKRCGSIAGSIDERLESNFLKWIHQPPPGWSFHELMVRFNANIEYSGLVHSETANGLFAENKEKLILVAINALVARDVEESSFEEFFFLLRRLVCSRTGFQAFAEMQSFREKIGTSVTKTLRSSPSDSQLYAALELISALLQPQTLDLRLEQENKEKVLNSSKFLEALLDLWTSLLERGRGALVTVAMLDILTFSLCAPYSETTLGGQFDTLLSAVADRAKVLFQLFQHPCIAIVKSAGLVLKALIEEGSDSVHLQRMALKEGALLRHLVNALYVTDTADARLLTLRQLSRHLIILWTSQFDDAKALLKRIFPPGLLRFLSSAESVNSSTPDLLHTRDSLQLASQQHQQQKPSQIVQAIRGIEKQLDQALKHWRIKITEEQRRKVNNTIRPVTLRKRRQNLTLEGNWPLFYDQFYKDHAVLDLIWNQQTREELKESLHWEIRLLDQSVSSSLAISPTSPSSNAPSKVSWNYGDFSTNYKSLEGEVQIGGYYLRLLLKSPSLDDIIVDVGEFFADLYHRFLLTGKLELRQMCLQAMTVVYGRYWQKIGAFHDLKFIVLMLEKTVDREERDRLVLFIKELVNVQENSREFVNCGGIRVLTDLITLAHLHRGRPQITTPQSNVLEEGASSGTIDSPEWYYFHGGEKKGPVGFNEIKQLYEDKVLDNKSKLWAAGLDNWRTLQNIPQLKWTLVTSKSATPVLNESELATHILDVFIRVAQFCPARDDDGAVIRPVHKAKQQLGAVLPQIVQLALTFAPGVVERVARLLCLLLEENPAMPRIYTTGAYFFLLMYTGSNIRSITEFLHLTHLQQAVALVDDLSAPYGRSILNSLLPPALITYLISHGVEKFCDVYLGEYDTPEAIWNLEMRKFLIRKIALHLADFSPRLMSNTRALYDYCAIPAISYENLQGELFCGSYYLRNLVDELRFPSWPITSPLILLKDILEAWKNEVSKPPPPMTVQDALESLDLADGTTTQNDVDAIKKAYRRLAQRFHPDKNPQGRERFEQANKAYEFLCSRASLERSGPDENRLVLILKAQGIVFKRFREELSPYKYSGYPMLIKTMANEIEDESLFAKSSPLLPHCTSVAYHTLNCSGLNVEELRREGGLPILLQSLNRCSEVLTKSSTEKEMSVEVCEKVLNCFRVATQFQLCRDKLVEMPQLGRHIRIILDQMHLFALRTTACITIQHMAVDTILQMHLLQAGVLWRLVQCLFRYDVTLEVKDEDNSPEEEESTNVQRKINTCSIEALKALKALAGWDKGCPVNDIVTGFLEKLFFPEICEKIASDPPTEVLEILNTNHRTPCIVWNNETRAELLDHCDQQLKIRHGEDISFGWEFQYESLKDLLFVGHLFVEIYNSAPTSHDLRRPEQIALELINYIQSNQEDTSMPACLEALYNVAHSYPTTVLPLFRDYLQLLATIAQNSSSGTVFRLIEKVLENKECLSQPQLYVSVLVQRCAVNCLAVVATSPAGAAEILKHDGHMVLLEDFAKNTSVPAASGNTTTSADCLSRLLQDKLHGGRVRALLSPYLPSPIIDKLLENPDEAINVYRSNIENPELIWNDERRSKTLQKIKNRDDRPYDLDFDSSTVVGGIHLDLYVKNKLYTISKPREFLASIMERVLTANMLTDLVVEALDNFLSTNGGDLVIVMGYLDKIMNLSITNNSLQKKATYVTLAHCSRSTNSYECFYRNFSVFSKLLEQEQYVDLVVLTLYNLFRTFDGGKRSNLAELCVDMTDSLVKILKQSRGGGMLKVTTANVVSLLQILVESSEKIGEILSTVDLWNTYSKQKHDLFLEDGGKGTGQVLYLTYG